MPSFPCQLAKRIAKCERNILSELESLTETTKFYFVFLGANGEERTLQFPLKLDLERPKRPRTTFSEDQLRLLEEAFQENGYLTGEARLALATRLALSDTQVRSCKDYFA